MNYSRPDGIDALISKHKILVLCGTGGVGKTTISAAIALRAALLGKRAVVVTIDPAKRLATSLGMEQLGDEPFDLTPRLPPGSGSMHALMPDTRLTFEQLIRDLGFDEAGAERVRRNVIFKIFAKEFSGTNEYMAMQKLHSLNQDSRFDFIVLDTPPSRNTLDFLRAPELLSRFYDDKIFSWIVTPANKLLGGRLFAGGMEKVMDLFEKLTGSGFMSQLLEFARSLLEVRLTFTANLKQVIAMLQAPTTGFLLVSPPAPSGSDEIGHFIRSVRERDFRFLGHLVNRSLSHLQSDRSAIDGLEPGLAVLKALQSRERLAGAQVSQAIRQEPIRVFPELARDIHSLEDLIHVALALDDGPVSSTPRSHPTSLQHE